MFFTDDDAPASMLELDSLTAYLRNRTPTKPRVLATSAVAALTPGDQAKYNRQRLMFLSGGITIMTNQLKAARYDVEKLMAMNLGRNSGNIGVMVSADSTLGKTTLLKAVMKTVHTKYVRQRPNYQAEGRVPIVFIEVPPGSTGKLLMSEFAHFLGLAIARSDTMDTIRHRVVGALTKARTQLIVIDELHNLSSANRGNGESIDVLKKLHNAVPATFLYAGIDLANGALLGGTRGRQLSGRFAQMELTRFNLADPDQAADWTGLVSTFEKSLPLADHKTGSLVAHSKYLWERTAGSIGSLGRLLTGAAVDIILSEGELPETITKELLDKQTLDQYAEQVYSGRTKTKNGKN